MISRFMGMKSSSIREDSALAWMQCSFLILLQSRERARWILEQERESSNPSGSKDRRGTFTGSGDPERKCGYGAKKCGTQSSGAEDNDSDRRYQGGGHDIFSRFFDVITTNPPYMLGEHGLKNEADAKTIARHEVLCTLDDILRESAKLLKFKGRFYMVHRPFRLPEILTKMSMHGIEPKRMRLVHPYIDKEPNMVLIEGSRGGRPRMKVEPPLIVYREPGVYTEELLQGYSMK